MSSILSSHHTYQPEPYPEDDWVEFIEVDAGDSCDKPESDTQRLLGLKDDDSGRASCYDPEFTDPETPESAGTDPAALLRQGPGSAHTATPGSAGPSPTSACPAHPPARTQPWVNMDFYAQVSDVTPSGGVVLSAGQQGGAPEEAEEEEEKKKKKEKEEGEEKEEKEEEREKSKRKKEEEEEKFQLVVVDPKAYTSERDAQQISAEFTPGPGYTSTPPQGPAVGVPMGGYQSPYLLIETPPCPPLPPVSDYTVVQDVDAQHSLLLNPTPPEPPQVPHPPTPAKPFPPMPVGYLTPDLLGNITP